MLERGMDDRRPSAATDRNAVILKHYPWVRRIAARLASRVPAGTDVDDVVSIGLVALIEAVDRFDPTRGVSFEGFARVRVFAAICQALEERIPEVVVAEPVSSEEPADADDRWLLEAREDALRAALSGLPIRERRVIEGIYLHRRSPAEIGQAIGQGAARVARIQSVAVTRLRAMMRQGADLEDEE